MMTQFNNTRWKNNVKKPIIALEAYNGLSAKLIEKSPKYSAIWVSSLTDSASRGLPDIELVSEDARLERIREIREVSTKPIIVDWDTGGDARHFPYWVQKLEQAGVNAIIIEDKAFPKINSLIDGVQTLEEVDKFAKKIKLGKEIADNILIFARLESLIAKKSVYNALLRAMAYIAAGADGIVIHSKQQVSATEVMEFAKEFRKKYKDIPLIAIPTTYKLPKKHPFNVVIYANHLFRASIKGMQDFLKGGEIAPVEDIFKIIGTNDKRI
jgi:phosphoenolpyruvate phosphomutase